MKKLERISKRWRERIDKVRELEIIENKDFEEFTPTFLSREDYQERENAEKLNNKC